MDDEDWAATTRWSVPAEDISGEDTREQDNDALSHGHEGSARLSTIPEGSDETAQEDQAVNYAALCEMFGSSIPPEAVPHLQAAYAACSTESAPERPTQHPLPDLTRHVRELLSMDVDIPTWREVETCLHSFQPVSFETALCSCNADPEQYLALDSDALGAYVALEAYGDECKLLEGLSRMPNADEHAELRVYETHSRKVVIERSDDLLTADELTRHRQAVTQATLDELKTWQGFRCFRRRPRSEAPCVIDVRWVYKWKFVKGERRIRARLCLRGFKEFGADDQSNFAATASRFSQRAIVSEGVLRGWCIASSDVPKAFLQGVSYEELAQETGRPLRDVSFELTGEGLRCLQALPEFKGFNPFKEVLHCLKPGTGCRDAPKCFSLKLRQVTHAFGMVCSIVDPEMELLLDRDGRTLLMAIVKHVDDLKMIGPRKLIEQFVAHVSHVFGKMEVEWSEFTFCGVHHKQLEDGSVQMNQAKFLASCKTITHPQALDGKADTPLPEPARRVFLSLLMTVAYGLLTRPDVAVFVVALQRESHRAQVIHVRRLNTLLKWIQNNPRHLTYPRMRYPDTLLQISDSSYRAKAEDGLSVRGLVSLRVSASALEEGLRDTACHLIDFASKAQRHVTRSTFSSELFAATDAADTGLLYSVILHELRHGVVTADTARQMIEGRSVCGTDLVLVVDAKSVSTAITSPCIKIPAEPSLLLHVTWLRSLLEKKRLRKLYWSDTRSMVADALTKGAAPRELLIAAMSGSLLMPQPYEDQPIRS